MGIGLADQQVSPRTLRVLNRLQMLEDQTAIGLSYSSVGFHGDEQVIEVLRRTQPGSHPEVERAGERKTFNDSVVGSGQLLKRRSLVRISQPNVNRCFESAAKRGVIDSYSKSGNHSVGDKPLYPSTCRVWTQTDRSPQVALCHAGVGH